ncbi:hypothetical protein FRC15_011534 [Serendipita sp. 397]|nr:hypothetical protein FRC15_011534 [Serendipita sp. 397]
MSRQFQEIDPYVNVTICKPQPSHLIDTPPHPHVSGIADLMATKPYAAPIKGPKGYELVFYKPAQDITDWDMDATPNPQERHVSCLPSHRKSCILRAAHNNVC